MAEVPRSEPETTRPRPHRGWWDHWGLYVIFAPPLLALLVGLLLALGFVVASAKGWPF